jgi:hypothetical protein
MRQTIRLLASCILTALLLLGCSPSWPFEELPPRPANVPADAVRLGGAKASWWVKCVYRPDGNTCQMFNSGGKLLWDERYLPYDGGRPVAENELQIDAKKSMISELHLRNGRILISERGFDHFKQALDNERAKRWWQ